MQVPPYSEVVPVDFEGGYYPIYGGEGVILGGCGGGIWYGGWYKRVGEGYGYSGEWEKRNIHVRCGEGC